MALSDQEAEAVREVIHEELATLGAHLLGTYGRGLPQVQAQVQQAMNGTTQDDVGLATLGGMLLQWSSQRRQMRLPTGEARP